MLTFLVDFSQLILNLSTLQVNYMPSRFFFQVAKGVQQL
jgi:hypothetical protein